MVTEEVTLGISFADWIDMFNEQSAYPFHIYFLIVCKLPQAWASVL